MKNKELVLSINNGHSFVTPEEALEEIDWDVIVNMMDANIREQVNRELAPCSNLEFLKGYLMASSEALVIG